MSEDLFKRLFDAHSRIPFATYQERYLARLPCRLLEFAGELNPRVSQSDLYGSVLEVLKSEQQCFWRNAEIYPYLNYLCRLDNREPELSLRCLRIHLHVDPFRGVFPLGVGFIRIWYPVISVYRLTDFGYRLENGLLHQATDRSPHIYVPFPHLFDDVSERLYRGEEGYSPDSVFRLFCEAMDLVADFCPDLSKRLCSRLSSVAFMPKQPNTSKSFSFRNHYIGGVFVSMAGPAEIAEQLIHEYYHQQIWPWWLIERPEDLPPESVTMVSPVTGSTRSVAVMVQAALIYTSVSRFYSHLIRKSDRLSPGDLSRAIVRLSVVKNGADKLFAELGQSLQHAPESKRQLAFIHDLLPPHWVEGA